MENKKIESMLTSNIDDIIDYIEELENEISDLKEDNERLIWEVYDLNAKIEDLNKDNDRLISEMYDLNTKFEN